MVLITLVNLWAFSLLCATQRKNLSKSRMYFRETTLVLLRWGGYFLLILGVIGLIAISPGDFGLITWFGLHPILILVTGIIASIYFQGLVMLIRLSPVICLVLFVLSF